MTRRAFLFVLLAFNLLASGCTRGIQLTLSQEGAGAAGAPTSTTMSAGSGSGTIVTTDNLVVFVRTSPFSFPQIEADGLTMADPFLETGIEEVFSRVEGR